MRFFYTAILSFLTFCVSAQSWKLEFTNVEHKKVVKHPKNKFKDSLQVRNYLESFQSLAIKRGFLLASFDSIIVKERHFKVNFHRGEKFNEAKLTIPDTKQMKFVRKNTSLSERFISNLPLQANEIANVLTKIQYAYENAGYPFVKVQIANAEFNGMMLNGEIEIQPGPFLLWKKINIRGDSTISEKYIGVLVDVKIGKPFNQKKVNEISQRIEQMPFLKEIKKSELLFTKDGVELFLYLERVPVSAINGIIGFQPDPVTSKLTITGEIDLKLLNLLKRGELLRLKWQSVRAQTQSLNVKLNYPFLFKTRFGLDGSFDLYKRDTSFLELKTKVGVQFMMDGGSFIKGFYENITSNVLEGGNNNPTFVKLGKVTVNSYGLAFERRNVDFFANPSRGSIIEVSASAGTRKTQAADSADVVSTFIAKGKLDMQFFIPISRRHVIRLANVTEVYSATEVFQNELYRFGGLNAQRGFDEDALNATFRTTSTLEYRFLLDGNSHVFAFFDQTWYENNSAGYRNDSPFGFGLGFAFRTTIGTFSISYALGKQLQNPIQFRDSKVHFGYIAYF